MRSGSGSRTGSAPWREPVSRGLRKASMLLLVTIAGVCPLLAGSVHRPAVIAMLAGAALALVCAIAGEQLRGRSLRGQRFSIFFLLLVLIPVVQLVPFPSSWRPAIDPSGTALLENAPGGIPRFWPLTLDPTSTRLEIGTAAATLAIFVLAVHGAAGRRRRTLVLNAIAIAGVVAAVSGITHRILGIERLYGLFDVVGAVLPGPFINPNHSAEFYELAAFAALALASNANAEIRIGWYVAAAVNAAVALTTLSRGSLLALFVGGTTFVWLRLRAGPTTGGTTKTSDPGRVGKTIAWSLFALACLLVTALALGALPVLDELTHTNLMDGNEKIVVWKDSLAMIARHPLGIGRHAFDRVYPAYKTLSLDTRFQFVENGPLQLLIDVGWPGLTALGIALIWLARRLPGKPDEVGAALVAALVAVVAHNLVDFGFETLGVRLPFAALAGVVIGRAYARNGTDQRVGTPLGGKGMGVVVIATVGVGMSIGLWAQRQSTADDIEQRWKQTSVAEQRRELAIQGGRKFPTDFFFPLLQSLDEPSRPAATGGPSPRLAALNRSMRLCLTCPAVHEQTARALRRMGLRAQALSSYRDTVRLAPAKLGDVLGELDQYGYGPSDLATLAVADGNQAMTVARYLVSHKAKTAKAEVEELTTRAERRGIPRVDVLLVKADLAVALEQFSEAKTALGEARRLSPRDGRAYAVLANLAQQEGNLELALEQARTAVTMSPLVADYARRRLGLVLLLHRWSELDDALERLKIALRQSGQSIVEVHLVAGQTHQSRGNLARALSEFRMAATLDATNPATWAAVGRVSEERGDLSGAAEAYQRGARLRPEDSDLRQAVARIEKHLAEARLKQLLQ